MANPMVRGWKYLMAWLDARVDARADPKVQLRQAIEEAQHQHQALTQQAAQVVGNRRQLELRLHRQLEQVSKLEGCVRRALVLADEAAAAGDARRGGEFTSSAEVFAAQLVTAEQSVEDLKALHVQAAAAADEARDAVQRNGWALQQRLAERTKLLTQLEQARMQERVAASVKSMSDESAGLGATPSLDGVREKVERRYATALAATELAQQSMPGRMLEVEYGIGQMAGRDRLAQIRESMRPPVAGPVG